MKPFRSLAAIAALIAAPAAIAQEQRAASPTHNESFIQLNERFNHAISNFNMDAMLKLYAENVLWLAPGAPRAEGLSAPEASYRFVIEHGAELSHTVDKTFIADDRSLAVMVGQYRLRAPEANLADDGNYLFVLKPNGDSWVIAVDMFNSDRPRRTIGD